MERHTMSRTRFNRRASFINSALQRKESGLVYARGRMYTRESPDGDGIQVVAYGNEIIAEIEGDSLTFHIGHHGQVSKTVTSYIKAFGSVLSNTEGFNVSVLRDSAPTNGYVARHINSEAAQFISNYVGDFFDGDRSAVEQDAVDSVEAALRQILAIEFGEE